MSKLFVVLVGNIASGKSTLCRALADDKYIICSRDALRYMIGAGQYCFDPVTEPIIGEGHDAMLQAMLQTADDESFVVDEVNVQSARRYYLCRMVDSHDYVKVALVLPKVSKNVAVGRRLKEEHGKFGKEVWEGVWERFNKAYTIPTKSEGFDHIIQLKPNYSLPALIKGLKLL